MTGTARVRRPLRCAFHFHKLVVLETRGWFDTVRCTRCGLKGRVPSVSADRLPDPAPPERCSRCDVEMLRQPFYEGSEDECWYCPCCRSKLRTVPMLEATFARRAAGLGMTEAEYEAHMESQRVTMTSGRAFTPEEMEHVEAFARKSAAEWEPACEHDTENPWT